jgi:hypothetical protein
MATNTQDSSTWLPLSGLEPGFAGNRAIALARGFFDGTTLTTLDDSGTEIRHEFADGRLHWTVTISEPTGSGAGISEGTDEYEAYAVDDQLFYVQVHHESIPDEAVSIVFDLRAGTCLSVLSFAGQAPEGVEPGPTAVKQKFVPSIILEHSGERGPLPHRTKTLIGRRIHWQYSDTHSYEHIYLNEDWYTWHCLAGPEVGQADTDLCSYFELRKGIYVFAWREKVIPCASVTIADHRDASAIRSWGVLFGPDDDGSGFIHFTFGAKGRLASVTPEITPID